MSDSGNKVVSSTATYGQAISSLEDARSSMTTIQSTVSDAKAALQAAYQGADGKAYAHVMETWLQEVDRIKNTCIAMENQLGFSAQSSGKAQANALQHVVDNGKLTPFGQSLEEHTYNAMSGS
ncbi:hypothetical protein ACLMNJ_15545 [Streptomyces seoulensis]